MTIECPKCHHENPDKTSFCGKCGTKFDTEVGPTKTLETPIEELTTGSTFAGRYQIIEELGQGGMGNVYRVFDKELKEEVALKLIKPEIATDKKTIERFKSELKLARKISHKNIGRMYELLEEKGNRFITMEYIPGEDLRSFIRRSGQLAVGTTLRVVKQICGGLAEAHSMGIIHRDLKPSNIMIDKEGNARIMDFGIARAVMGKSITGSGVMIGTPDYMSPEQAEGEQTDQRSDIYSLGVILFEMVTGEVPFKGKTPLSVAMKHKSEIPPDPTKINPQISDSISRLILHCLEKIPGQRFQNIEELLDALSKIEKGFPAAEKPPPKRKSFTSKEISVKFQLKKLLIPSMLIALVAIFSLIIWKMFPKKALVFPSRERPYVAILYVLNNSGLEDMDHWRQNLCQYMITDLYQSQHIDVLPVTDLTSILRELDLTQTASYSSEDLEKFADKSGVSHILQASLSKTGNVYRVDYSLINGSSLKTEDTGFVTCREEDNFPDLVDEITKKVKYSFHLSTSQITDDIDLEIGKVFTRYPEALQHFMEAEMLHFTGENHKAIQSFQKAVEIDSEFAMAYRQMGLCYINTSQYDKAEESLRRAFSLKDKLPIKEQYLVQGSLYSLYESTLPQAREMYEKILDLYPDDFLGNHSYAIIFYQMGEYEKGIDIYEKLLPNNKRNRLVYGNLTFRYNWVGNYGKAREHCRGYLDNVQEDIWFQNAIGMTYIIERKFDLAAQELEKAVAIAPNNLYIKASLAFPHFFQDDFEKTLEIYQEWLDSENSTSPIFHILCVYLTQGRINNALDMYHSFLDRNKEKLDKNSLGVVHFNLGHLYAIAGKPDLALKEFELVLQNRDFDRKQVVREEPNRFQIRSFRPIISTLAQINIEAGRIDEAIRMTDLFERLTPESVRKLEQPRLEYLKGCIALAKNQLPEAVERLKNAISLAQKQDPDENRTDINVHALYQDALAQAYWRSGDLDRAMETYENLQQLTTGRYYFGHLYAKSYYNMGKICEEKGWSGKAIDQYEKFLSLWKNADPDFPEVEDARKRLDGLKSH